MSLLQNDFELDLWYEHIVNKNVQGMVGRYKHKNDNSTEIDIYKFLYRKSGSYSVFFYTSHKLVEVVKFDSLDDLKVIIEECLQKHYLKLIFGGPINDSILR